MLIELARKLPISWQHKLRDLSFRFEYFTDQLVLTESDMCVLLENTDPPDFYTFNSKLEKMKLRWKRSGDPALARLGSVCRLAAWKQGMKTKAKP